MTNKEYSRNVPDLGPQDRIPIEDTAVEEAVLFPDLATPSVFDAPQACPTQVVACVCECLCVLVCVAHTQRERECVCVCVCVCVCERERE